MKILSSESALKYDYIVNPDDIKEDFWGKTFIVTLTGRGITFIVNSECEQTALDETMDFIVKNELFGLYTKTEPEFSEDYIQAGNSGYWYGTYNVDIKRSQTV